MERKRDLKQRVVAQVPLLTELLYELLKWKILIGVGL